MTAPAAPAAPAGASAQTLALRAQRQRFGVADAALAGFVIAIVALMVVPLPTWMLDLLIASNLACSVAVLLVALYVGEALKIAAFPTLLLITTLFRLALNVSSSRLILLQADAGDVIRAFGQFVVRGNYVVGGVIFLILTIIQFVVIAKGSERVAEVGARFTLDAMPGKQMAIDAELRSGSIDGNEARRRRRSLLRESQFYGAMDGAMKFVKGDVIASLIITIINLLGGIAIGVGQRDMELGAALKRYGLLTIGDGLVTQIPALVMATAAGVLVTRVASEENETPLGAELAGQIFGQPQALRVGSFFVLGLALVPGLPGMPFLAIGTLMFAASRARLKSLRAERERLQPEPIQRRPGPEAQPRFVPLVVPWAVEVSKDLEPFLDDDQRGNEVRRPGLRAALAAARELVFRDRGVPLPAGRVVVSEVLPERHAVLALHEVPALLVVFPQSVTDEGLAQHLLQELLPALDRRASDFLGLSEVQALLDELEQISPASVRQVVPKPISLIQLTDILRRLVEERVNIRDLRAILEALSIVGAAEKDPLTLAEFVRAQLRRPITHSLTRGARELPVLLLDSHIEETIRGAITRTPAGAYLALAPIATRDIVSAVRRGISHHAAETSPVVILTQPDIRRFVRKLLEPELPEVRVLSFAELLPEVAVKPLGRATVANL
ncbi:MAG: Flagellar biosynthesis protein FlhA [Polyangiaceae bacterium]|jgi:type III secretion protein V|nr:Flagellar biosynthesis protein FlhA [Polyangiaceae bacterium]